MASLPAPIPSDRDVTLARARARAERIQLDYVDHERGRWLVGSQSSPGAFYVLQAEPSRRFGYTCTCESFQHRATCTHVAYLSRVVGEAAFSYRPH